MMTFLQFRAWADLRELAHAHGLTFHTRQTKAYGLARLRGQLIADGRLRRSYRRLPHDAKTALDTLRMAGGQMPRWQFQRRYGQIRIWRPWRGGVPRRPLNDNPSLAEHLWHLGFIEIRRGRPDEIVMPRVVWHMLAPGAMKPRRRVRPARYPAPAAVRTIRDRLVEACDQELMVTIEYLRPGEAESTVRRIDPQAVIRRRRQDYVEAWCHRDRADRTFRIDRILRVLEDDT